MTEAKAFVPNFLSARGNSAIENIIAVLMGVAMIALLAQIAIPLPFTPVPITGQTFGVTLLALLYGRNRGLITVLLYLAAGAIGLPVFAKLKAGLLWGPTIGYLIGMPIAALVVGHLSDRGYSRKFLTAWASAAAGSVCIFTCGLLVLSQFVPSGQVFQLGFLPFLPGDLIKGSLAAWVASRAYKLERSK